MPAVKVPPEEWAARANAVIARLFAALDGEDKSMGAYCAHWIGAHIIGTEDGDPDQIILVRSSELGGQNGYTAGVMQAHGHQGKPS